MIHFFCSNRWIFHPFVLNKFNGFHKNLRDGRVRFLDLEITNSAIDVFRKPTHTGQHTHFKGLILHCRHVNHGGLSHYFKLKEPQNLS